jgi:iron(III) transport system substrate-binding protein
MSDNESSRDGIVSRRRLLQAGAGVGMVSLAGCNFTGNQQTATPVENQQQPPWYGSGPGSFEDRAVPGGTSMADMPDMSGTLNVYSGRGQGLVGELLEYLETRYSNLTINPTYDNASRLANRLVTEGGNTPADVFYSVNAGALGFVANEGSAEPLAEDTYSLIGSEFRASDNSWVGTSGRARTVPFNTNQLSASDVPDSIMDFPDLNQYAGEIGWAPTYGSCKAFVTAMRLLEGESATRQWLNGMQDLNIQEYGDEYAVAQAVADGELALGLTNHYYIQRVLAGRSSAPIDTAFTQNDAGTVFNVAGAARIKASQNQELADLFVRHLLSSEAQEYFAIKTFEYPLVDGVDPVGRLPSISDLSVPEIDLSKLSEQDATVELMRDTGVL